MSKALLSPSSVPRGAGPQVTPGSPISAAASAWSAATSFALAGARLKRSLKPRDHLEDLENMKPEETILRIGDSISLFSIESNGYVSSEGFIDSDCHISTIGADKRIPDHFSDCVFKICPRNKYDAQTALNDQLDSLSRSRESLGSRLFDTDPEVVAVEKKLLHLKKHEIEEANENHAEFGRVAGNPLSYGQTVQLLHIKSNKFVTVTSKEIATIETHCLRVYLDPVGNEGSWFTILPRFKTMAEGENIHLGDQIILESKCYNSVFLHVSRETLYQKREVNATTEKSSWRIIPFAPYVPESDSFLKAGDVIRFFHKEAEGYLTNELPDDDFVDEEAEKSSVPEPVKNDEVYLQLYSSPSSPADKQPFNSNALWQLELDRPNRGGVIQYDVAYRLKHIATGHYLAAYPKEKERKSPVVPRKSEGGDLQLNVPRMIRRRLGLGGSASEDEEEEPIECTFTTVKEFSNSATLFTVHPLGTTIDADKRVKLESYLRIRHVNTKCYLHACKESQDNKRMKLMGREDRLDEDAFAVIPASREEIDNLLRVVGQVAILKQCAAKLAQGEKMDFTKTSLTVAKGVAAMDTKRVISVLKDLIISCTISSTGDEDVLSREGIPIPANQDLLREQHVIGILMNLLQQTFSQKAIQRKAYEKPENYTLFIIAQHAYKLLKQILKKNPTNRMAMSKYVNYFQKRMTFPPCTDTLMELFRDNHNLLKNIADDQILFFIFRLRNTGRKSSYIKFLSILCRCGDEPLTKNQNFICEKLIVENHDLLISIRMIEETGEVMIQPSAREPWIPIEEFMNEGEKRDDKQIYFIRTIKLLSNLCLGRNSYASTKISRVMTYPLVLRCMTNPDLPFTLRASFCLLMQYLYVDVEPYKTINFVSYTRMWSDLDQKPQLNAIEDATVCESRRARADLCKYVGYYIADNSAQSVNAIAHNKLTLAMVVLMKRMFELGFWLQSEDELQELITSILALLDPSTEVSEGEKNPLFKQDDRTIWIMKTKHNLCAIMDMFFNLRLDRRLSELLIILRKQMDGSTAPDLSRISKATEEQIDEASKVWNSFTGEADKNAQQASGLLDRTLRYLVMCDYNPLSLAAGNLLVRHFSQRFELLSALQQVQVLVTDKNVKAFQIAAQKTDELKVCIEKSITKEEQLSPILTKFTRLCGKNGKVNVNNQRILKNLDVHKVAIELIHLPLSKQIFSQVFQFLAAFCKDNADNQGALFEYLDLFLKMMEKDLYVAVTINELFNNNRALCSQITEVQIRKIVNAIESQKLPRYIQVLMTLIMPNDIPLRRNQNLVLKMLMEKQQNTLVLFNDPESIEYRNSLIKKKNYEKEDSVLKFHCMQIELITKCSLGKIYEAEVRCQSLFSMGQIRRQLTDPINLRSIKSTFIKFLEEVYFLTQKPKNAIELDPQLWAIFSDHFTKEIADLTKLLEEGQRDDSVVDYVANAIIPFLINYFSKYYNRKDATARHKAIADQLLDALSEFFHARNLTQAVRIEIGKCIDAMNRPEVNIRGTNWDLIHKANKEWRELIEMPKEEKKDEKSIVAHDASQEENVIRGIQQFVKYLKEKKIFGIEQELRNLARIFQKHLDTFTKKLIELLKNCESGSQQELTWVTLRTLYILLEQPLEEALKSKNKDVQALVEVQNNLNRLGATSLILHLISSSKNEERVYHQALKLGIALLHGGNEEVQRTIHQCFINNQEEGFFSEIRSRIRRSIIEIKEKQQFYFRLLERKRAQEHQRTEANAILFRNDKFGTAIDHEMLRYLRQTEGSYPESGFIRKILRFLQLLCEGHNKDMQNYLRSQTESNDESYDLISETATYLEAVEREIDPTNIKIAQQLFITLTEYCQGPCPENQVALMRTKLVESANWVLSLPDDHPLCHPRDVSKLKKEAVITLLSLLEGNQNPKVPRQMLMTLNFSVMEKTLDTIFPHKITEQNLAEVDEEAKDVKRAFLYYFLIKTLADHDKDNHKHLNRLLEGCNGALALKKGTASIEIVRDNKLERIYFQRPRICKQLPPLSKKNLLHNVNRENQASKIEDFFDQHDYLIQEMMHRDSLAHNVFLNNLSRSETFLKNVSFGLTIIINLLIIWSFTSPRTDVETDEENDDGIIDVQQPSVDAFTSALLTLFGMCQIGFAAILLFIEYEFGFRLAWKQAQVHHASQNKKDKEGSDNNQDDETGSWWHSFAPRQLWFAAKKSAIFYFLAYLVFAVCGVFISPFFFAFHLLDIGARSKELKYVISSVTQNGKSIILTAILALIIIYIYTIFGFLFFRDKFVQDDIPICESMLMCFVNVVNYGLRSGGGVGDLLKPPTWGDPETPYRILYDSTFFFVVIVILLNIIFGIIIDTFGELRSTEETIESDSKNNCFICGIDNITFDRQSEAGFEKHWKYDHNMWNYLYFRVHLNIKDSTEYTGPEQYIAEKLEAHDLSFIPNQKAMCLGVKQEEDEEKAQELINRVESMTSALQKTTDSTVARLGESMDKKYNTLNASLLDLAASTSSRSVAIETKLESRVENVEKHISELEKKLSHYLDNIEKTIKKEQKRNQKMQKEAEERLKKRERQLKEKEREKQRKEEERRLKQRRREEEEKRKEQRRLEKLKREEEARQREEEKMQQLQLQIQQIDAAGLSPGVSPRIPTIFVMTPRAAAEAAAENRVIPSQAEAESQAKNEEKAKEEEETRSKEAAAAEEAQRQREKEQEEAEELERQHKAAQEKEAAEKKQKEEEEKQKELELLKKKEEEAASKQQAAKAPAPAKKKPSLIKKNSDSESDTESSDGWDSDDSSSEDDKKKAKPTVDAKKQQQEKEEQEKLQKEQEEKIRQQKEAEEQERKRKEDEEAEIKRKEREEKEKQEQEQLAAKQAAESVAPASTAVEAGDKQEPKKPAPAKKPSLIKKNSDSESDTESSDGWDSDDSSSDDDKKKPKQAKAQPAAATQSQPAAMPSPIPTITVEQAVETKPIEKKDEMPAPQALEEPAKTETEQPAKPAPAKKPSLIKKNSDSESDTESSDGWDSDDSSSDDDKKPKKGKAAATAASKKQTEADRKKAEAEAEAAKKAKQEEEEQERVKKEADDKRAREEAEAKAKEDEEKKRKEEELARRRAAVKKAMKGDSDDESESEMESESESQSELSAFSDTSDDEDSSDNKKTAKKGVKIVAAKKGSKIVAAKKGSKIIAAKKGSKIVKKDDTDDDSDSDESSQSSTSEDDDDDDDDDEPAEKPKVVAASRLSEYAASQPDFLF